MSYNFLHFKLEDVIKNYLKSQDGPECPVWGFGEVVARGQELAEPWIGVRCRRAQWGPADVQMGYASGGQMFDVEIAIRSHAEDIYDIDKTTVLQIARDNHGALVGQVVDMFYQTDIQDRLNNAAAVVGNISIDQVDQFSSIETGTTDRSFVTTLKFNVLASSSN